MSDGRYVVDAALARPERGFALERFVFALRHRERAVTLAARPGTVTEEFVALAGRRDRTAAAEARLDALRQDMADRLMAMAAADAYEILDPSG